MRRGSLQNPCPPFTTVLGSVYTRVWVMGKRYRQEPDYNRSRKINATRSTTTPPRRIAAQKYERDISGDLDAKGITDPKQRQQIATQSWIQFARSNSESDPVGFQFDTNRSGVPRRSGPLKGLATVATHTPGSQLAKAFAKARTHRRASKACACMDKGLKLSVTICHLHASR